MHTATDNERIHKRSRPLPISTNACTIQTTVHFHTHAPVCCVFRYTSTRASLATEVSERRRWLRTDRACFPSRRRRSGRPSFTHTGGTCYCARVRALGSGVGCDWGRPAGFSSEAASERAVCKHHPTQTSAQRPQLLALLVVVRGVFLAPVCEVAGLLDKSERLKRVGYLKAVFREAFYGIFNATL